MKNIKASLKNIPTPALVIDAAVVQKNIQRMADYAHSKGIALRPHIKTHKSKRVAKMQLEAGAIGLTTAKVGEAEVMQDICDDILIAYPIVDAHRAERAGQIAKRCTLTIAIDSSLAVETISHAAQDANSQINLLVELDVGLHRTGVQSAQLALQLATQINKAPHVALKGLMYFPGNVSGPSAEQPAQLKAVDDLLKETIQLWKQNGLNCEVVSGGSTPTVFQSDQITSTTEIRPGTAVYNDRNSINFGVANIQDCAARFIATVVSTSVPGQVVLDAGSKTLTSDKNALTPESGHGLILEYPNAMINKLNEEHGYVDVTACEKMPSLGERVTIIPNHICPCVNLQENVWWLENDSLTQTPVDARGLLI